MAKRINTTQYSCIPQLTVVSLLLLLITLVARDSHSITHTSGTQIITDDNPRQSANSAVDNSRRLEERRLDSSRDTNHYEAPSDEQPARRRTSQQQAAQHQQQQHHNHKNLNQNSNTQNEPPKTEERLLISISNEDRDTRLPDQPYSGVSSLSSGARRPIVIAIQDSSSHNDHHHDKHTGSSASLIPAVVVRPSGQSIVISTGGDSSYQRLPPTSQSSYGGGSGGSLRPPSNEPLPHRPSSLSGGNGRPVTSSENLPPIDDPIDSYGSTYPRPPHSSSHGGQPLSTGSGSSSLSSSSQSQRPQHLTSRPPPPQDDRPPYDEPYRPSSSQLGLPSGPSRPPIGQGGGGGGSSYGDDQRPRLNDPSCGLVYETKIVGGEEADPENYLWMAAIIKAKQASATSEARPFCGGSLITNRHILTAAHCLEGLAPRDVLVRLGSYDFEDSASSSSGDYAVDQFRVPAEYSKKTHVGDIAIMRLKTPLASTESYKTVCMPQPRRSYVGSLATVIGYGTQSQSFRKNALKLRQVTVPVWENRKCGQVYKKELNESFLCAGYEEGGKDACQGDSGGPLMAEGPNQRLMVIGVVSHGIGCGAVGIPGTNG
ncbi:hypothetical protein GZH46_02492, partial [Fragariocoptes setiger]